VLVGLFVLKVLGLVALLGVPGLPGAPGLFEELEAGEPPGLPANIVDGPPKLPPELPLLCGAEAKPRPSVTEWPVAVVGTDVGKFNGATFAATPPTNPT